ncbi:MAG TPA: M17 family peptidase N-terminal domain-containing protein, partial [Salinarimonas sp.]|nr:M17 family peptidase N-terminal domain-containing protein [Salinarimonas sp.]
MADRVKLDVQSLALPRDGDLVVLVGDDLALSEAVTGLLGPAAGLVARAAGPERFKGKAKSALTLAAPAGLAVDRLIVVGLGAAGDRDGLDLVALGGTIAGKVQGRTATVLLDAPGLAMGPEAAADIGLGMRMRLYAFDRYKTRKKDEDAEAKEATRITLALADPAAAKKAVKAREGLAEGVALARDLVNEPPNVLGPVEFAERAAALEKLGVEVEILDERQLAKIGMRALLAVGQGSERPSRVAIMRWTGGRKGAKPLAVIGKGVVFD